MKILYIITKSNWGGAQRHVYDLAIAAKKNGQNVVVALGGEGELRLRLREAGITTRPIVKLARDVEVRGDFGSLKEIYKLIGEEKPDILHLHSTKAGGLGALAGRLRRVKKIIFTAHGWAFNEDRPLREKIPIAFISWATMLLCTHIITLSDREYKQTRAFPFVGEKVRTIRLGIESPTFFSRASALQFFQSHISTPLTKKYLLGTIAELHSNKGHIYALHALEKLRSTHPNFIYFLIGDGEERPRLENYIQEKGLQENVKIMGYVSSAAEYLRGLDLYLQPSLKEGLPYVLIEAGFAGLPTVATTVGGIPELIVDMETGILIQPKKSDELHHAIAFLMEHKSVEREYARAFQERAKKLFNIEQMLNSTFRVYAEPAKVRQ